MDSPFLVSVFIALPLLFIAYCVGLGVLRNVGDDGTPEVRLLRNWVKGLHHGLWFCGWILVATAPLYGAWLLVQWAMNIYSL